MPREKCTTFERDPVPGRCRTETRMECRTEPRQECREVVDTECRQVPKQRCDGGTKREQCNQVCEPVYWCKVCQ